MLQNKHKSENDKAPNKEKENKEYIWKCERHSWLTALTRKRGPLRIMITVVGIAAAIAISIAAYYWIKSYVLKAIAFFLLLKAWVVAPFAWAKGLWASLTDLTWAVAPFAWMIAFVKKGFMAAVKLVSKFEVDKPRFMELDAWTMWLKRPEWLKWHGGALRVPEVVENGFEVFMPDGIQAIEEVIEEI